MSKQIRIYGLNVECKPLGEGRESCDIVVADLLKEKLLKRGYINPGDKLFINSEVDVECEDDLCTWHVIYGVYSHDPVTGRETLKYTFDALVTMSCTRLSKLTVFGKRTRCTVEEVTVIM